MTHSSTWREHYINGPRTKCEFKCESRCELVIPALCVGVIRRSMPALIAAHTANKNGPRTWMKGPLYLKSELHTQLQV